MMLKKLSTALGLSAFLLLTACGKTESYVENWNIKNQGSHFLINATFNKTYEVDGEALINFKKYGTIYIGQSDDRQFTISLDLDTGVFGDADLARATTLPNGDRFPSIVSFPLGKTPLKSNDGRWAIDGYFGLGVDQAGVNKSLAGVGIQIGAIGSSFPVLSITQNYFTADNRRFGALTMYGPKLDAQGRVITPGGLFLVADINVLRDKSGRTPSQIEFNVSKKFEVRGPDAHKFKTKRERQLLALQFLNQLEQSGIVKRR